MLDPGSNDVSEVIFLTSLICLTHGPQNAQAPAFPLEQQCASISDLQKKRGCFLL